MEYKFIVLVAVLVLVYYTIFKQLFVVICITAMMLYIVFPLGL